MVFTLVSAVLEQLLNQLIKLDEKLVSALTSAAHKQLSIEITDLSLSLKILFDGNKFIVLPQADSVSDCFISADLDTLLELKKPEKITQLIRSGNATIPPVKFS